MRAATLAGRSPELIQDSGGSSAIPAIVAFDRGAVCVGRAALARAAVDPESAVRGVKWFLGRKADDAVLAAAPRDMATRILTDETGRGLLLRVGDQALSPQALAVHVLRHVAELVERRGDRPGTVVISVPPWLPPAAREALIFGGDAAGLGVERVLPDAVAVVLGLPPARQEGRQVLAVVDVGAGGVSASILRVRPKEITVLSSAGDGQVGGDEVDRTLMNLVLAERWPLLLGGAEVGLTAMLCQTVESLKRELSDAPEASALLPFLPRSPTLTLDRRRLARALSDLLRRIEEVWARALEEAGLSSGKIDAAYATGGMTQVPAVRVCLDRTLGRTPTRLYGGSGTAFGAARFAAMLAGTLPAVTVNDSPASAGRFSMLPPALGTPRVEGSPPSRPPPAPGTLRVEASPSSRPPPAPGTLRIEASPPSRPPPAPGALRFEASPPSRPPPAPGTLRFEGSPPSRPPPQAAPAPRPAPAPSPHVAPALAVDSRGGAPMIEAPRPPRMPVFAPQAAVAAPAPMPKPMPGNFTPSPSNYPRAISGERTRRDSASSIPPPPPPPQGSGEVPITPVASRHAVDAIALADEPLAPGLPGWLTDNRTPEPAGDVEHAVPVQRVERASWRPPPGPTPSPTADVTRARTAPMPREVLDLQLGSLREPPEHAGSPSSRLPTPPVAPPATTRLPSWPNAPPPVIEGMPPDGPHAAPGSGRWPAVPPPDLLARPGSSPAVPARTTASSQAMPAPRTGSSPSVAPPGRRFDSGPLGYLAGPPSPARPGSNPAALAAFEVGAGRFVNPGDAAAVLALPMHRPVEPADLDPITLPLLLLRVFSREDLRGVLTLERGGRSVQIHVADGKACLSKPEHQAATQAFLWRDGTFTFEPVHFAAGARTPTPMARLAVDGLRVLCRSLDGVDLEAVLGPRLELAPVLRAGSARAVALLGLTGGETRLVQGGLDGTATGKALARSGVGRHTALELLLLLTLFGAIDWVSGKVVAGAKLSDEVEARARKLLAVNHFEALEVHWSATTEGITEAHQALRLQLAPDGAWARASPEACARMRERIDAAYAVLRDPTARIAHRRAEYQIDFDAAAQLMEKRADALSMRQDEGDASQTRRDAKELAKSKDSQQNRIVSMESLVRATTTPTPKGGSDRE